MESWDDDLGTDRALSTVVAAVLGLSGALGEHLLDPAEARDRLAEIVEQLDALPLGPRQRARTKEVEKLVGDVAERVRLLDVVAEYRRRKRATDSLDFGDQVALAARLAREVPVVGRPSGPGSASCSSTSTRTRRTRRSSSSRGCSAAGTP